MADSVSIAFTGSGGAGVMTAGQMLLDAAAKAGYYGVMARSSGPQIRGGEAAALVRLSNRPVESPDDAFHLLIAFDWGNVARFAAELPLTGSSLIVTDPAQGDIPEVILAHDPQVAQVPFKDLLQGIAGARPNMLGLGLVAQLIGLPLDVVAEVATAALGRKGDEAVRATLAALQAGATAAAGLTTPKALRPPIEAEAPTWNISGNEAAGLGALRGGVRFVAAYPITPATEILEWMAPNLGKLGGALVQAEDELASINMIVGSSFGGVPSLTATSGPGLALMTESIGLAVASETPVVVVDVMRGGPSTGIPTKSEQSDLNIALYGLHGDAPHVVVAPNSIADCLFATHWAVHLAEALQTPAIVLSDQAMGQSRAIIDKPADIAFVGRRLIPAVDAEGRIAEGYRRYALTTSGVSPMAIPGTPGGEYTADGLEHNERGTPSSQAADHERQLDKRHRKLADHDYGDHWADIEGDGDVAVITWGSVTGPVREAVTRSAARGLDARLISIRLLSPVQPEQMTAALSGVSRLLVVEQTHSAQFYHYLRAHYDLPADTRVFHRSGPLPVRPGEIEQRLADWS